jgi:hypothetical protein
MLGIPVLVHGGMFTRDGMVLCSGVGVLLTVSIFFNGGMIGT